MLSVSGGRTCTNRGAAQPCACIQTGLSYLCDCAPLQAWNAAEKERKLDIFVQARSAAVSRLHRSQLSPKHEGVLLPANLRALAR